MNNKVRLSFEDASRTKVTLQIPKIESRTIWEIKSLVMG